MFLTDFIKQYKQKKEDNKNETEIKKDGNNVIFSIKNGIRYNSKEELYINTETGNPSKLIVQDDNQKAIIYILYNEIKLNI